MKTDSHFWSYLAQFFLEWDIFQKRVLEKLKTYILWPIIFFLENRAVIVEKYCRAGQATDENMAHAHCMLNT